MIKFSLLLILFNPFKFIKGQSCDPKWNRSKSINCEWSVIQFEANSPGMNTFFWDFNDGMQSGWGNSINFRDPAHMYSRAGHYIVIFKAEGSAGKCTDTLIIDIRESPKISINQISAKKQDFEGNRFCFIDSSTAVTGSKIKSIKYKFTDGGLIVADNHKVGDSIFYSINDPHGGCFGLRVEVEDSNGCPNFVYYDTIICVNPKPCIAGFSKIVDDTLKIVKFTNKSSQNITNYNWTFGDGQKSSIENPTVNYSKPGNYRVTLIVTDTINNCMDSFGMLITIKGCISDYKVSTKDINALKVSFSNGSSKNSTNYLWDFGDGKTSTVKNPTHTYSNSGGYTVTLESFDSLNNGKDKKTEFVELYECKSFFTKTLDTSQQFKLFLINKSSSYNSNIYLWQFGDGTSSNQKNPTHKYNKFGKFNVCLFVKDSSKTLNCTTAYCDSIGIDSNGRLLKAGTWELIVLDETAGINNLIKSDFKIYPNPANLKLTVDLRDTKINYNKIEILNSNGQICKIRQINNGSDIIEVDLENMKPGLYLVKLSSESHYSYLRMIKN